MSLLLEDEADQAPEWREYRQQKRGELPKGTYDATLRQVIIIRRRDTGAFVLRLLIRTERLGRAAVAWQGLADEGDDPYQLSDSSARAFARFRDRLGIPRGTVEQVVRALGYMMRDEIRVQARISITPVGPQATLSRDRGHGDVLVLPDLTPEDNAGDAWRAHHLLLEGLQEARLGLARAAEGCHHLQLNEGWLALGFESLSEYLASPEVTLTRSDFYRLAAIWSAYVLDGGLEPAALQAAGPSKLEVPLPAIGAGLVGAEQALADAESMTRADLRDRYAGLVVNGDGDVSGDRVSRRRDVLAEWLESEMVVAAVVEGREALGLPQRLPGARQAVRSALERMLGVVEGSS